MARRLDPRYLPLVKILKARGWVVETNFQRGCVCWPIVASMPFRKWSVFIRNGLQLARCGEVDYMIGGYLWGVILNRPLGFVNLLEHHWAAHEFSLPTPVRRLLSGITMRKWRRIMALEAESADDRTRDQNLP